VPYWQRVRGIQQREMHASGLLTGSNKFRLLSVDPGFRFELGLSIAHYEGVLIGSVSQRIMPPVFARREERRCRKAIRCSGPCCCHGNVTDRTPTATGSRLAEELGLADRTSYGFDD